MTDRTILALDLGTKCGYAMLYASPRKAGHAVMSGTWKLTPSRFESAGQRFAKLTQRLKLLPDKIDAVFYEEVRSHKGVDAAHIYGGLVATLQTWCEERGIPYRGVPVGTIKRSWTGKGNASKDAMIEEARRRGYSPQDDNEADALALLDYALKMEG